MKSFAESSTDISSSQSSSSFEVRKNIEIYPPTSIFKDFDQLIINVKSDARTRNYSYKQRSMDEEAQIFDGVNLETRTEIHQTITNLQIPEVADQSNEADLKNLAASVWKPMKRKLKRYVRKNINNCRYHPSYQNQKIILEKFLKMRNPPLKCFTQLYNLEFIDPKYMLSILDPVEIRQQFRKNSRILAKNLPEYLTQCSVFLRGFLAKIQYGFTHRQFTLKEKALYAKNTTN